MPYDALQSIELCKIDGSDYLGTTDEIDAMAEACLKANALIQAHGTTEMQATMRILLFQIGQKITLRQGENEEESSGR